MPRSLALALLLLACDAHRRDDAASAGMIGVLSDGGEPLATGDAMGIGGLQQSVELTGVLHYKAVRTDVMTVDAYLGDRITLTTPDGEQPLVATDAVDKARLQALDGHRVTLTATWSDGKAPDPNVAAPMNGDQPMRQGVGFRVMRAVDQGPG
jgi:hypothetical protein